MVQTDIGRRYSLLITDDDHTCRETLRDVFEPRGYRTLLAADGEQAVDIVRSEHVHLALLDLHMPRLNGLETIREVKQINAVIPCILVTADTSEEVRREALLVEAFTVLIKPLELHVTVETVHRALEKAYSA